MRVLWLVGVATLGGAASVAAQHGHEYEFGLFGSYTKYDASFDLSNAVGAGVRMGYRFGDVVGFEADVLFQQQYTVPSTGATMQPLIAGVNLNVNLVHGEREMLYVLGGYSLLDFGTQPPYEFTDGGIHGALGDRLFLSHHVALRVEGGAIYTPSTGSSFGTKSPVHILATAGLSFFGGGEKAAAPPKSTPPPAPPPVAAAPAAPLESVPPAPVPPPAPPAVPSATVDTGPPPAPPAAPAPPPPPPVVIAPPQQPVAPAPTRCTDVPPGTPVDSLGCALAPAAPPAPQPPPPPPPPPAPVLSVSPAAPPPPAPAAPTGNVIGLPITFGTQRAVLTPSSAASLDQIADMLVANPTMRVEVAGYTDNLGPTGTNLRLSRQRAGVVKAYLVRKGVSAERLVVRGYGSANPIAPNTTSSGRAENRRVELHGLN